MSNNLFDITITTINTTDDTLTLTDEILSVQYGTSIYKAPGYIDNTNNYVYYNLPATEMNITTTADIKDLGFVIVGDSNDYYYYNFVKDITWSHSYTSDTYTVYDSYESKTNAIIQNYSPTNPLSGIISDDKYKNGIKHTSNALVNIDGSFNLIKNISLPNNNYMTTIINTYNPGATGGISKGNIPIFEKEKSIQFTHSTFINTKNSGVVIRTDNNNNTISKEINVIDNIYTLTYDSFDIITTSASKGGVIDNTGGEGTDINNASIYCESIKGKSGIQNYGSLTNITNNDFDWSAETKHKISNLGIVPFINSPTQIVSIKDYPLTSSFQLPFIIDSWLLDKINVKIDNATKTATISGSSVKEILVANNYNGITKKKIYNWNYVPIIRGYDSNNNPVYDYKTKIINTVNKIHQSISNEMIDIYDPSTKYIPPDCFNFPSKMFALIYYKFTIPPIIVTNNNTTLNINFSDTTNISSITVDLTNITYLNSDSDYTYTLRVYNNSKITIYTSHLYSDTTVYGTPKPLIAGSINSNSEIFDIVYVYRGGSQPITKWYINSIVNTKLNYSFN